MFSLEFNEHTWTCHFLLFYFCWTIRTVLHEVINIWSHDYSEFAFLHVLTDCSVSCSSKHFPISFPESFCARLKKRKTLGRSVEDRILIGFYENNTNDQKSLRTKQNGGESSPKGSACVQVLQL